MRKFQILLLVLVIFALGACNDDDNPTSVPIDLTGDWTGVRVVQVITPVNHPMAVQLWANINSLDPPLTVSGEMTKTGDELSIRLTDTTGYYINYSGTMDDDIVALSSTMISYPPMVTRITCLDGIDRHYDIQSAVIHAIVHEPVIAGTLSVTANVIISDTGVADGEIVLEHTINLNRTQ